MQSLCATLLRVTPSSLLRATGMGLPSAEQDGAAWRRMWLLLLLLLLQVHDGRASRAAAGRASRGRWRYIRPLFRTQPQDQGVAVMVSRAQSKER